MKEWSEEEEEEYKCGSVESLPVWVRLPAMKAHLMDLTILGMLCSRLGKPICTDGVTAEGSSYNFARVCVEIYADQEFAEVIEYEDPYGNGYTQRVIYEWKPPRCTNCCNFGHVNDSCPTPNLDKMIEDLRNREREERRKAVEKDMIENVEESEDETQELILGENLNNEEEEEVLAIPETQMGDEGGGEMMEDSIETEKETIGEAFRKVLSKSALKRAKKKGKSPMVEAKECHDRKLIRNDASTGGKGKAEADNKKISKGKKRIKEGKGNGTATSFSSNG